LIEQCCPAGEHCLFFLRPVPGLRTEDEITSQYDDLSLRFELYLRYEVLLYTDLPTLAPAVTPLRRNAVQVSAGVWAGFTGQAGESPSYFLRGAE